MEIDDKKDTPCDGSKNEESKGTDVPIDDKSMNECKEEKTPSKSNFSL